MVDDDPNALRYVRDTLAEADYAPVVTGDPEQLPELIRRHKPRLILLDLVLPDTDGIKLMEGLRGLEDLPVIFISAYDRDETIVRALDAGAADYIAKPFSPSELTARVRAALRRRAEPEPFLLGDLAIHYEDRRVTVAGRLLTLTMTEFEVLRVLSTNAGRAVTYDSLRPPSGPAAADGVGLPVPSPDQADEPLRVHRLTVDPGWYVSQQVKTGHWGTSDDDRRFGGLRLEHVVVAPGRHLVARLESGVPTDGEEGEDDDSAGDRSVGRHSRPRGAACVRRLREGPRRRVLRR